MKHNSRNSGIRPPARERPARDSTTSTDLVFDQRFSTLSAALESPNSRFSSYLSLPEHENTFDLQPPLKARTRSRTTNRLSISPTSSSCSAFQAPKKMTYTISKARDETAPFLSADPDYRIGSTVERQSSFRGPSRHRHPCRKNNLYDLNVWKRGGKEINGRAASALDHLRSSRVLLELVGNDNDKKEELDYTILHPDHAFRVSWDLVNITFLVYILITLPINLAFEKSIFNHNWLERLMDIFFLADILVQFRTSTRYHKGPNSGRLEKDPWIICKNYLKSWFIVDLVASFPFDLIFNQAENANKILKLGKAVKIIRILRISRIYRRLTFRFRINASVMRLIWLLWLLMVEWHWIGCLYWAVASAEGFSNQSTWSPELGARHLSLYGQYIRAFFWAVNCTTGVGNDIIPESNLQNAFTTISIIFGLLTYATIVASVSSALQHIDTPESRKLRDLESIQDFLTQRHCSSELTNDVLNYYNYCYERHVTDKDEKFLEKMHESLRSELDLEIYKRMLQNVPRFAQFGDSTLLKLIDCFIPKVYLPEEVIYLIGEQAEDMFFVIRGSLECFSYSGQSLGVLNDNDFFGDDIFTARALRNCTVISVSFTEILILHQEPFLNLVREDPVFGVLMATFSERRKIALQRKWKKLGTALKLVRLMKKLGAFVSFTDVMKILNGLLHCDKREKFARMTYQQYMKEYNFATSEEEVLFEKINFKEQE